MQVILANAKIMYDKSAIKPQTQPLFSGTAEKLAHEMACMDREEMARQLKCSHILSVENQLRYQNFLAAEKMPAIMAYNGHAYKHLQARSLDKKALAFAQGHLWITSFLYGLLRPMDGIVPYRMEHSVRLEVTRDMPLDRYWKDKLTDVLIDSVNADDGRLVHLSTAEYEHLFDWKRVCRECDVIHPLFYVRKGGVLKIQAVWAKACRGAMTRFVLENRITKPEELRSFVYEGFAYDSGFGENAFPHFIRNS